MTDAKTKSNNYLLYIISIIAISVVMGSSGDISQTMLSAAAGGGLFAALCLTKRKVWISAIPAVVAPSVVYLMTGSIDCTALSLSFLPVGVAVCYGISKNLSRMKTVVLTIGAMIIFYGAVQTVYVYLLFGSLTPDSFSKFVELNLDVFRNFYMQLRELYVSNNLEISKIFTEELIEQVINETRVMWCGYALAAFGILGFISTVIAKALCKKEGAFPEECGEWKLVLSKLGAIVFIFAYIAGNLYSSETEGLYLAFAINAICFGIAPAVLYMGASKILRKIRSAKRTSAMIIFLISISVFGLYVLLTMLIIGIYATLTYEEKPSVSTTEQK